MTKGLELASRNKKLLYKITLDKNCSNDDVEKYKDFRNSYNKLKRTAMLEYYKVKRIPNN